MIGHATNLYRSTIKTSNNTSNICENPLKVFFTYSYARTLDMEH